MNDNKIKLKIFDVLGREVAILLNENLQPGIYEVVWDGSNYPSGIYFYKLEVNENSSSKYLFMDTKKLVLVK